MRKYQVRFRGGITEKGHSYLVGILPDTNDGRKLALDIRLINPMAADDPNGKVSVCAQNVFGIWEQHKEKRSTQLVFCDLSTPKGDGSFNVYDDLKKETDGQRHSGRRNCLYPPCRYRGEKERVICQGAQRTGSGVDGQHAENGGRHKCAGQVDCSA